MDLDGRANRLGMELLNQSNYKVWKTCIESSLVGEDLWDAVNGNNTIPPADAPKNSNAHAVLFGPRDVKFLRNIKVLKAYIIHSVKGLANLKNFGGGEVCEGFQYRKAHRLPFDRSLSRGNASLELIHSDLMWPTRTPSFSGYSSMLIFFVDFTRFTWVYFVKHKSEVFSNFADFKETVEGELDSRIRKL
uniref:Uncharacterized protein LOC104220344 n=1 Tax=Nicotiana sylvestris TaxID=4096 RepID=A0A1U7W5F5_NICSY|nr:PREDICTED: uncharacterized protein LOC104220344 [Nicotiana sylvestris]